MAPTCAMGWVVLTLFLILPAMGWAHGEIEGAGEEKIQRVVPGKNGSYRLEFSISPSLPIAGEDTNIELNVVRVLPKPDPLLGAEVPLATQPTLSVLDEASHKVLDPALHFHDEGGAGEAGVFAVDGYHFPSSGSMLLRFVIHGEQGEELAVDFPVSVKTNVGALFRLWVNISIAIFIAGLTGLQLWKIRARGGEASEMLRPAAVGAVCWIAVFLVMNYFVLDKVLALRKAQAPPAPTQAVKTNDDGSVDIPAEIQKTLGIELVAAKQIPAEQTVSAYGAIEAKPDNTADVVAPLWGRIEFIKQALSVGDKVDKAQPLVNVILELSQLERQPLEAKGLDIKGALNRVKERRDAAKIEYERAQKLAAANPAYEQDLKWAKELYDEAEDTFQQVSKEDKNYAGVVKFRDPRKSPVYAPIGGYITFVGFTAGQLDLNGEFRKLFTIVDTSTVWARADVFLTDAWKLKAGDEVMVHPAGHADVSLKGSIHWISDTVDPVSRTVPVLADIPNPKQELGIGGFVRMEFPHSRQTAFAVPDGAVMDDGTTRRVYLAVGDDKFQPVEVTLGTRRDGWWQVLSGLQPGDRVIAKGAAVLGSVRIEDGKAPGADGNTDRNVSRNDARGGVPTAQTNHVETDR